MYDHTHSSDASAIERSTTLAHTYFAYGSNLSFEQMASRCPDAIALGAARLDDHALRIGARGYASVSPLEGAHVWGGLWSLTDACLLALDRYEGVAAGLYRREVLEVAVGDELVDAIVYIENHDDHGWPDSWYLGVILDGAADFELPDEWIAHLRTWS